MKIFVSCGEVSGDIYAGGFIREALKICPYAKIYGMLGPEGVKAGGVARWSYDELKLMGLLEIVPAIPRILRLKRNIAREILRVNPESVVLVDSPDFHLMLAKSLRKSGYGGKIISLSPPTVWAWRPGRVVNLRRDFDFCLPLFSFEHEYLLSHGVKSLWQSHPLVREMKGVKVSDSFRKDSAMRILSPSCREAGTTIYAITSIYSSARRKFCGLTDICRCSLSLRG